MWSLMASSKEWNRQREVQGERILSINGINKLREHYYTQSLMSSRTVFAWNLTSDRHDSIDTFGRAYQEVKNSITVFQGFEALYWSFIQILML